MSRKLLTPVSRRSSSEKGIVFVQILVISVTVVVVAVPEGDYLPIQSKL
jgi:hypothetical protein